MIEIHSVFTGGPRTITGERGTWRSTIFRTPVNGEVRAGDEFRLEDRPNPGITQRLVNECAYGDFDPVLAQSLLEVPELAEGWKKILRSRL